MVLLWSTLLAQIALAEDLYYADDDGDGYGNAEDSISADSVPEGYVSDSTDCDDTDDTIYPSAGESCDGVDSDCSRDEGDASDGEDCSCNVEFYDGRSYLFCEDPLSWDDAQAFCEDYGHSLSVLSDADEEEWVNEVADSYSTQKWWFGFNDQDTEGDWVWVDGSDVTYTNWAGREPNNVGRGEDCAQLNRYHPDLGWNDEPCSRAFRYVCEAGALKTWYPDEDGDGYGDPDGETVTSRDAPEGYVRDDTDCDDTDAANSPGPAEIRGDVATKCSGDVGAAVAGPTWYTDGTGDS